MEIEEEMRRKIVVSVAAVVFFVAGVLYVGATYNHGGFSPEGGYALLVTIVAFVLVMAVVGAYLDRSD